ncbi:MAG: hypothetical protein Q8R92_19765 [Deltaproteobacteria bacterium]|nr:hypothetical protein [Deltaproteobacteria bacterium]
MALTAKQEAFARAVAIGGMNQTAAYASTYEVGKSTQKSIQDSASRLAAEPQVKARIKLLTERAAGVAVKKAGLTLAQSMAEAESLLEDAQALGQISAGVAAAKLRAQLAGHLVEKKEEKTGPLTDMDVTSLLALKAEVQAQLQRNKDALDLVGDLESHVAVPLPLMRRVIG